MQAQEQAIICAAYALDKKALNPKVLDVRGISPLTDYLVLVSGGSDRQVQAIAEAVHKGMKKDHEQLPLGVEGLKEGRWILLDYGDVMVHVFQEATRQLYDLDGLWSEAPVVDIPEKYHWEKKGTAR